MLCGYHMRATSWLLTSSVAAACLLGVACGDDPRDITIMYDQSTARVLLQFDGSALRGGEKVFIRTRRGKFDQLDCSKLATEVEASTDINDNVLYGPVVNSKLTDQFYADSRWVTGPTPEMLAQIPLGIDSIIDVCIVDGTTVTFQKETDLFTAWDSAREEGVGGKADDASGETAINSVTKYADRCVAELGEIPFFKKLGEGSYETYDCLNSTPIPLTVTENGTVTHPQQNVDKCDQPQYIYSLCEAGPRVATRINDQGTRWVLLCRKSIGGYTSNQYNDIAMIGNNPFTGKTCFFQNALYDKIDGGKIPHPGDVAQSANMWRGVQGGVGGTSNIECQRCHGVKPFIHSPWIDGAKDLQGRSIVPKIGEDPDYPTGANDAPYSLVNYRGQGWNVPKQATGSKVAACTQCHRVDGDGIWTQSYFSRLNGTDTSWNNMTTAEYLQASHKYWMPPNVTFTSDADFAASAYAQALSTLTKCSSTPADCGIKPVPTVLGGDVVAGTKLRNKVAMSDADLAQKSIALLGFGRGIAAAESRCGSCHTPTRQMLTDWSAYTQKSEATCLKNPDDAGTAQTDSKPNLVLRKNALKQLASYDVAAGGTITVKMTGAVDADLYVRRGSAPTRIAYDCRPFVAGSANETCDASNMTLVGPGKFYIAAYTKVSNAKVNVDVTFTAPSPNAVPALTRVQCFKKDQVTDEILQSRLPRGRRW
jgi:mono/diheme cytochrome c family protein